MPTRPPIHRPAPKQAERDRKALLDKWRTGEPGRKLKDSAAWAKLRTAKLRANPLCQCEECQGGRLKVTPATVVDHIVDHKGDPELFFAWGNLQSMSKEHHDRKTAATAGFNKGKRQAPKYSEDVGADGMPTDPRHPFFAAK